MSDSPLPWFRQLDAQQWRAFFATFLGWLLDGFDFTIMTFILLDIQESFTVDAARRPILRLLQTGDRMIIAVTGPPLTHSLRWPGDTLVNWPMDQIIAWPGL